MKTVGQIIRERREALGLTLAAVAGGSGLTKSYLSMIENHRVSNPPSAAALAALERALEIADGELCRAAEWQSMPAQVRQRLEQAEAEAALGRDLARWLKKSTTRRRDGAKNLDEVFRSGELRRRVQETLKGAGGEAAGRTPALDAQVGLRYRLPLINRVAAGYPRDFTDLDYPARVADEYVSCPDVGDPSAFAARVVGDSMLPDYAEGDIVVFSPAAKVGDGADCFARLDPDHETTFKRVFFEGDAMIRLQPLNPRFAPVVVERARVSGLYKAVLRMQRLA